MYRQDGPIPSVQVGISLPILKSNFCVLFEMCKAHNIEISGVTKSVAGNADIARAMLASGIRSLADSRLQNIHRLRLAGIDAPIHLLRPPTLQEVAHAVQLADVIYVSELVTINAIADKAREFNKVADIVIMVDMGDLREGAPPEHLFDLVREIEAMEAVQIIGIATNFACHIGLLPTEQNLKEFAGYARRMEAQLNSPLKIVSGGNSSSLMAMQSGEFPKEINHLRLGESLLLGRDTLTGDPIAGTRNDGFTANAEILELWERDIDTSSPRGMNAFGKQISFKAQGTRRLAVLSIGAVDAAMAGLTPVNQQVNILGYSSDHTIVDVSDAPDLSPGDRLHFTLDYSALASIMSSPYTSSTVVD